MMVVFTDEVGEDENRLEDCVTICKRNQMPVYVVGVPAPFGRPNIEIKYVDPDPNYDQSVQWIPVRQGPETFVPEQVQLNFSRQVRSRRRHLPARLRLRPVLPDAALLRDRRHLLRRARQSRTNRRLRFGPRDAGASGPAQSLLRSAGDEAVSARLPAGAGLPQERLEEQSEERARGSGAAIDRRPDAKPDARLPQDGRRRSVDEASARRSAKEGGDPRAADQHRSTPCSKRARRIARSSTSRAGAPGSILAYGRILAVKVRTEAYNLMLARAKGGMKLADPKTNVLTLVPVDEVTREQPARQDGQARSRAAARASLKSIAARRGRCWPKPN